MLGQKRIPSCCIRSGNQLITSVHTSDLKGVLGKDLTVEQCYAAARNCAERISTASTTPKAYSAQIN